jgi:hypothetical protein
VPEAVHLAIDLDADASPVSDDDSAAQLPAR